MSVIVAALTHLLFFTRETAFSGTETASVGLATVHRGVKRSIADADHDDAELPSQSFKRFKADPSPAPLDAALALAQRDILPLRKSISLGRTTSPLSPHPVPFVRKSLPRSRSCRKPLSLHRQALLRWHDMSLKKRHPARPSLLTPRKSTPLPPVHANDFRHNLGARSSKPLSSSYSNHSSRSFPSHHSTRSLPPPPRSSRSGSWPVSSERHSYAPSSLDLDIFAEGEDFDEDDEFDDDESDEEISDEEDAQPVKDYGQQIVLESPLVKVTSPSPVSIDIVDLPIPPLPALTHVDVDEEMDEDDSSSDSDEEELDWDVVLPSETRVTSPVSAIKLPDSIPTDVSAQTTLVPAGLYDRVRVAGRFDDYA